MRNFWLLIAMSMYSATAASDEYTCASQREIVAKCLEVRGRLSFWNGAPSARIWRVGTTRMLGVHNDDLPPALASRMDSFDTEVWGTFTVCPFTRQRAGHMQFVCIESWHDIEVRHRVSNAVQKPV